MIKGGFSSVTFRWSAIFLLVNTGCSCWLIFIPRSPSRLRTTSADFWSLNGNVIRTGLLFLIFREEAKLSVLSWFFVKILTLIWPTFSKWLFTCESRTQEDTNSSWIHWTIFFYKSLQNSLNSLGKIRPKQKRTPLKIINNFILYPVFIIAFFFSDFSTSIWSFEIKSSLAESN